MREEEIFCEWEGSEDVKISFPELDLLIEKSLVFPKL